jgi:hypothetical protein
LQLLLLLQLRNLLQLLLVLRGDWLQLLLLVRRRNRLPLIGGRNHHRRRSHLSLGQDWRANWLLLMLMLLMGVQLVSML